jgi:hypothetical protein
MVISHWKSPGIRTVISHWKLWVENGAHAIADEK